MPYTAGLSKMNKEEARKIDAEKRRKQREESGIERAKQEILNDSTQMLIRLGEYRDEDNDAVHVRFSKVGLGSISAILSDNTTVRSLDLKGNGLYTGRDEFSAYAAANALKNLIQNRVHLLSINLRSNFLTDNLIKIIVKAFSYNLTLVSMDLRDNLIDNKGAEAIAAALEHNFTLTSVKLEGNPEIGQGWINGDRGVAALARIRGYLERNKGLFRQLCEAIHENEHAKVSELINEKHVSVNQCNDSGYTSLMLAVKDGNFNMVSMLLQHCRNISERYTGNDEQYRNKTAFEMVPDCTGQGKITREILKWDNSIHKGNERPVPKSKLEGIKPEKVLTFATSGKQPVVIPEDCKSNGSEWATASYASSMTFASSRNFFSNNDSSRIASRLVTYLNRYGEDLVIIVKKAHYIKV